MPPNHMQRCSWACLCAKKHLLVLTRGAIIHSCLHCCLVIALFLMWYFFFFQFSFVSLSPNLFSSVIIWNFAFFNPSHTEPTFQNFEKFNQYVALFIMANLNATHLQVYFELQSVTLFCANLHKEFAGEKMFSSIWAFFNIWCSVLTNIFKCLLPHQQCT